jgi:regulator of chromosome condensation
VNKQFEPASILSLPHEEKVVHVAAGNNHMLVLTTRGSVYALGAGEEGQLGRRVLERRKIHGTTPEKVVLGTRARKAVLVATGNNHSFAVDEAGDVWAWGLNSRGQTGTGVTNPEADGEVHAPTRVPKLARAALGGAPVVEIVGGDHHTLFRTEDGRVFACGRSDEHQLGLAAADPAFAERAFDDFLPEPAQVTFPDMNDPIVGIGAGTHGSMAVSAAGVLYAWGAQTQGEVGLGDLTGAETPTVVVRATGQWAATAVSCGGQHSVALLKRRQAEE